MCAEENVDKLRMSYFMMGKKFAEKQTISRSIWTKAMKTMMTTTATTRDRPPWLAQAKQDRQNDRILYFLLLASHHSLFKFQVDLFFAVNSYLFIMLSRSVGGATAAAEAKRNKKIKKKKIV